MSTRRVVHPSETHTEMTWIVMPSQANALGTVFGGQIMAWVDVCAAVSAQRFTRTNVVTAGMDQLSFLGPIKQGDVVVVPGPVNWAGRTSMEVGVRVEREDPYTGARRHTSSAYLTFVALDEQGRKAAVPTLEPQTELERRRFDEACLRRDDRLAARKRLEAIAARSSANCCSSGDSVSSPTPVPVWRDLRPKYHTPAAKPTPRATTANTELTINSGRMDSDEAPMATSLLGKFCFCLGRSAWRCSRSASACGDPQ